MNVFIFGDQTADQVPLLKKIVSRRDNSLLATFLERASLAVREEIQRLPKTQRDAIPDFLTISQLVQLYHEKGLKVPAIESVLVTVAQLGHYIGYFCENVSELPNPKHHRSVGLCTGLLAATAVTCAKSLSDLLPLAVEAVRISFRAGVVVGSVRDALQSSSESELNWSTIVADTSESAAQAALDQFHDARAVPLSKRAYVSAVSLLAVTISGPPSTTRDLFEQSELFREARRVPIPVYAPYHAAHLFGEADYNRILDDGVKANLRFFGPSGLLHSAHTGHCHEATSATELFQLALEEILAAPVRWDSLLNEAVSQIMSGGDECSIMAVGVTNIANSFVSSLKAGGQTSLTTKDHSTWGAPSETFGRTQYDKIAIVGMAGRFPSAANHDELWALLEKGLDVHREIPSDRFDAKAHCDPSGKGKNKTHTPFGCFIDEPGLFDPRFFNMSPREAAQTDPMGRLALVTAYEALEMSGYVPNRTPSTRLHRIGTFYGQTSDDWREINAAENIDTYFITGGVRAFAPGRINYYFKFSGPSFSIDTACSSSLAAIQLACTSLWAGDCDTACAGGLNVLTNPDIFSGLSKGQFLSKTGSCKTYDNGADGYCRGDGCGTVILKRYEDAIADNDNILGCILGAATNHSAEAVSITHPHAGAQEFLYRKVLEQSGVDAHDISYVEMHGTGTQAGDGIEMTSVTNAFAPRNRQRRPDQTLHLGAVKANIGHGEAASGINSLIKVLMMLKKNAIPANVGIKGIINQSFPKDLAQRNVHIPTTQTPYLRNGAEPRKLFLNNFSAAGGNTAIIIEDGPLRQAPESVDPRSTHLITVSARSIASLKRNIENIDDFLAKNPTATLPSLAYTTTARRIQHNYRVAFTMSDISNVRETLMAQMKDTYSPIAMVPTRVAFTFTGQGSQYTGLGKKLYEDLSSFRNDIHDLDRIAQLLGFPSFTPLLDGTDVTTLSPVVVQLGMSCIQVALARMWACWGITPIAVIGHSLGEYAALHVAGVLSASDMIFLVGRRAQLLEQDCTKYTHGMLAVKASVEAMEELLGDQMPEVACINGPEETVLCGTADVIARISDIVAPKGFKSTKLNVPFAFHSAQVDPILEAFKRAASSATFNKPAIPVLSPLTGDVIREAGVIGPDYLARHARETVNFWVALCQGVDEKIVDEKTAWLEVGAHPVCSGMVRSSLDSVPVTASSLRRGEDPWKTLTNSLCSLYLAGVAIDFNEFHREFSASHELLTLPTYSFDNKRYWLDYHNNWCLTKGEAPVVVEKALERVVEAPSKLSTTSCQKIVHEQLHANSGTVVIRSNMAEPKLHKVIAGHKLNGSPLCPSSLYADMAMTVADYLYKQLRPAGEPVGYNVCQMEVHKPLVPIMPPPAEGQWLEMEANADLDNNSIHLKFRTVTPTGELLQDHGHGLVRLENSANWIQDWSRTQFMVQSQVDLLKQKLEVGAAHKILRGMAYKLFKVLVDYDTPYRGMEEVILDGQQAEATAKVRFQNTEQDGDFFCAPFWIDSLAHISGFIVNATDTVGSDLIYISHGWEAIRIAKPLSSEKTYRSYVRMLPAPRNIFAGDVYIFDGEDIIGVVQGLKFQGVTQKVFNIMVPPAKQATAAPTKSAPAITAPIAKIPVSKQEVASVVSMPRSSVIARVSEAKLEKAKKVKSSPFAGSITSRVMKIIAEETDVDMSELVDEAAFENLGVDSLMSLTISAKFREDLNMEISSTLFTDNPTVGEMKKFFGQYDGAASLSDSDDSASEVSSDVASHDDDVSTPASSAPSTAPSVCDKEEIIKPVSHATSASVSGPSIARQIIAEEMGVSTSEIADTADLAEMGMDSLMSLAILGSLREKTGIDLPSTFLMTNSTMEDIENALGMRPKPQQQSSAKAVSRPRRPQLEQVNQKLAASKPKIDVTGLPPANSVLLQGNARVATKKLFLVPDGSGSATSYVSIPNISSDVAVYGLNCPFMKQPKDWTCGVEGVSALYLNEIRRRQPSGPYMVGGWSAGGVFAYEVTCQLLAQGEQVERLVLIDAPCPVSLEPLPARLHVFFDQIGLLGTGKAGGTPSWLLPHFAATIQALSDYEPTPMAPGRAPPTTAIWCSDGVCPNPGDPRPPAAEGEDPAPMKWLLNNRTDFGDNGWGQLLPGAMEFAVMGGNHFTMMKEPHAATLGRLMREGMRVPQ